LVDSLGEYLIDMRTSAMTAIRNPDPAKKDEALKTLLEVDLPKHFTRLDSILKKNGTGFFVGSNLTYIDLLVWYYIENFTDQKIIDLQALKLDELVKFKAAIEARPNIAKYRANPNRFPLQYWLPRYVLHAYPGNINAQKSLIAALYGGIKIEYPAFNMGVDNKTPEFLKKNPNGQVPTLDTPDGPIWESNAMARYVARKGSDKGLYGSNEYETSQVDQWIEWFRSRIEPSLWVWLGPIFGFGTRQQESYEKAKTDIAAALAVLEGHLTGREWVVGKRVTLADITLFVGLHSLFTHAADAEYRKPYPSVAAWVERAIEQPNFKAVVTGFSWATKEKQPGELARH